MALLERSGKCQVKRINKFSLYDLRYRYSFLDLNNGALGFLLYYYIIKVFPGHVLYMQFKHCSSIDMLFQMHQADIQWLGA